MPDVIKRIAPSYAKDKKISNEDAEAQITEKLSAADKAAHGATVSSVRAWVCVCVRGKGCACVGVGVFRCVHACV